jgi:hypothetical protein
MNTFFKRIQRQAALALVPLALFAVFAGSVQAAPSASFSAAASGTTSNLTISVTANVADADVGLAGKYYVGFRHNNIWYFHNGTGWTQYTSGVRPAYASRALASGTVEIVRNMNLTSRVGGQLFIGYGQSESEMLAGGKYALVYTVTAESVTMGPAPVLLGTSGNFAILAKTAVSTVPPSVITGNVGVSPAATSFLTGFSLTAIGTTSATSPQVTGVLYGADMTAPTSTALTTAVLDMQAAYTDAAGRSTPDYLNLGSGDIGGKNLPAGLYRWGSSVTIPANLGISGGANDIWIFQISGDLIVSAGKLITLADGAQAKNIFWQVAGQVTIGAGAHVQGNILSQTGITLQTGARLTGRALAQTAVVLDSATVLKPAL